MLAKLQKLGTREKWGLIIAFLFIVAVLVDRLVIKAVADRLRILDRQIAIAEKQLAVTQGALQSEELVREAYEQVSQSLAASGPQAEQINLMKGEVYALANKADLENVLIEHKEPRPGLACDTYFVEIRGLEGDMSALLRFLDDLHHAPGLMRVQTLSLSPMKSGGQIKGSMVITKVTRREGS